MLINLKNANICQREGRLVLGNVNLQVNEGDFIYDWTRWSRQEHLAENIVL